jgi:peptide deformylase
VEEYIPWQWLILGTLESCSGHQAMLQDIYILIEEDYQNMKKDGTDIIKPKLLDEDIRYGPRPKYQHTVRGCLSNYIKHGWVNRIDRATYQLTDEGKKRLKWIKENT